MSTMSLETCCHRVSVLTCCSSHMWHHKWYMGIFDFCSAEPGNIPPLGVCHLLWHHRSPKLCRHHHCVFLLRTTSCSSWSIFIFSRCLIYSFISLWLHVSPPLPLLYSNLYITHHPSSSFCLPPPLHLSSLRYVGVKLRLYFPFWCFIVNALLHPIQSRCCGNTV